MKRKAPRWLRAIVPAVASCLEATGPMAPLGYSFRHDEAGWLLCVYPRLNELIGGAVDGRQVVPGFRLCLTGLMLLFDMPPHVAWEVPSDFTGDFDGPCLALEGDVNSRPLELLIFDRPPPTAKVGMLVDWRSGEARRCKRPG